MYARMNETQDWQYVDVYLNGVRLRGVIAADDAAGWLERVVLDSAGYPLIRNDKIIIERLERLSNLKLIQRKRCC